uniref:TIP41-like protein n=1 Tax=Euplotes crassus TaxID=5936 RepID=A0A7S3K538_EUPCR|mmetsp:Transcript_10145/g.10018  ORF Transcript_10145/g.10018 Transcript_10145/m.10018 type:complete len:331 (+) Transcript_10145:1-993(+)
MSSASFPIAPKQTVEFNKVESEGWEFYVSNKPMFNTKELDQIADVIPTQALPDIVFGYNRIYMVNKKRNFLYEFSPIDALTLCSYAVQTKRLHPDQVEETKDEASMDEETKEVDQFTALNRIDLKPKNVEVSMADKWKDKDTSKIEDFKELEIISDWTYSTPYKGTVLPLSENVERIKQDFDLEIELQEEPENSEITIERTEEEIPIHRLTPENPILHYMEIEMFEDELEDCGHTMSKVRFRIMKDCFYALVRYYLRVDGVIVRILDTRIFHDFETNHIIREFWHKEATYDELRAKHFDLSSEWGLDPNQSDRVFNSLELKFRTRDKISF